MACCNASGGQAFQVVVVLVLSHGAHQCLAQWLSFRTSGRPVDEPLKVISWKPKGVWVLLKIGVPQKWWFITINDY